MKVLFISDDAGHAWPMVNALLSIRGLTFEHHFGSEDLPACQCDVVICHSTAMNTRVFEYERPVVLLDRIDGAQLGQARNWISNPAVKAVLKGYTFRNPEWHNWMPGRAFLYSIGKDHPGRTGMNPISPLDLAKIVPFYGFGAYEKLARGTLSQVGGVDEMSRATPVHFAGTVNHDDPHIAVHRQRAVEVCRQCGGIGIAGRQLTRADYYRQLLNSRAVLSPAGWGEACHRDYEAWAAGCILIKPRYALDVKGMPDEIFTDRVTHFTCENDFSDVPDIVSHITLHWRELVTMRKYCRQLFVDCGDFARHGEVLRFVLRSVA